MSDIDFQQHENELPPAHIAFIIDNKVVDILRTDYRLAAIFLSNPTIVDITDDPDKWAIQIGTDYNNELGFIIDGNPVAKSD